jgi:hypothetical protein
VDTRTKETGRRLLGSYYAQQKGLIAYIDESFRGSERQGEFPFYLLSAVLIKSSTLSTTRENFLEVVGSEFWHTTKANIDREYALINRFTTEVQECSSEIWISLQLDLKPENLELARREAMLQLIDRLSLLGCGLAVYEQRNTSRGIASDASLVNRARKAGIFSGGIVVVGSKPSIEPLLWGPDLVSWCFRQVLTAGNSDWFEPISWKVAVLDVSGMFLANKKRPETAAALNSGPVSPAPQFEAKAIRSSKTSIPNYQPKLQDILAKLPNLFEPRVPPAELRSWLKKTFPN